MRKFILNIIIYSASVLLIAGLVIQISIEIKPEIFKGSYAEYLMWEYQKKIISTKAEHQNIILGDSRALAGIVPSLLGKNYVNLSLGGATPIDGYYTLKKVLLNKSIDTILIAYSAYHYMESDQFNSRTLAFNFISENELNQIEKLENKFNTSIDGLEKNMLTNINRWSILNSFPFPYYQNAYISNLKTYFTTRTKPHEEMKLTNGHVLFGRADSSNGFATECKLKNFKANAVIDFYVDSLISLGLEHNCQIILISIPFNLNSYYFLEKNKFNKAYNSYLISKKEKYLNHRFKLINTIRNMENNYFGDDAGHLNKAGSYKFSNELRSAMNQ